MVGRSFANRIQSLILEDCLTNESEGPKETCRPIQVPYLPTDFPFESVLDTRSDRSACRFSRPSQVYCFSTF